MKIDINRLKMYLSDPQFPPDSYKTFVVLDDMKSPCALNVGHAFVARTKVIPPEWSTEDLAKYIKNKHSSFAFYTYEDEISILDEDGETITNKAGKIRYGSPKLKIEVIPEYVD